jgi:hypothetical protein
VDGRFLFLTESISSTLKLILKFVRFAFIGDKNVGVFILRKISLLYVTYFDTVEKANTVVKQIPKCVVSDFIHWLTNKKKAGVTYM